MTQWMYDNGCWFRLPRDLRERWWKETNYGRVPPSQELRDLIAAAVEESSKQLLTPI
jgi:hypothetical protein